MRFRSLGAALVLLTLSVTMVVGLRAADEKAKAKATDAKAADDVVPAPGTIKFATAPAAVQKTFKDETKNAKIELLGKAKPDEKDGEDKAIYRAIVGIGDNNYDLIVGANGQVLSKILEPFTGEAKLEDCPAPVQKAFQAEMKGGKVESIKIVTAGKRSDFVMDVVLQKLNYQVTFTEDGTLMSKIFDDGSDSEESGSAPAKESEKKEPEKKESAKPVKKSK